MEIRCGFLFFFLEKLFICGHTWASLQVDIIHQNTKFSQPVNSLKLDFFTDNFFVFLQLSKKLREKCPNTEFFSSPYFPVFRLNTGKYEPENTSYLDNFHTVKAW